MTQHTVRITFDFVEHFVLLFLKLLSSLKERSHRIMYEPKSFSRRFFLVEKIIDGMEQTAFAYQLKN